MEDLSQQHWENIYQTKNSNEVSWTQEKPNISLQLIQQCNLLKTASIIDIGGGDSNLVDYLLQEGFENITVLDISKKALEKAQQRLGKLAEKVKWIVSDITKFNPTETYDLWHDRAAFHFLTQPNDVANYIKIASKAINRNMIIGTFSTNGPTKCSGLTIQQYNETGLTEIFSSSFTKNNCTLHQHTTPFNTTQEFIFCSFIKNKSII